MHILFLGDLVGRTGREAVLAALPDLRMRLDTDLVVVNAENASHGFGLGPDMAETLFTAGVDVITLGNHAWDRKEIIPYIADHPRLIRPANYPHGTPGAGSVVVDVRGGRKALVMNLMGRIFMDLLDCPFQTGARELVKHRLGASITAAVVDFHAEASSEKIGFAHSFDGEVSLVVGTHTHIPTADQQILPGGTAFMTDAGMCGDYDSVIGMQKVSAISRLWKKVPSAHLQPAEGPATVCGVFVVTDDATGLATRIEPLRLGGRLAQMVPSLA